jgi:calcineurin-like phosphoesterase family protein
MGNKNNNNRFMNAQIYVISDLHFGHENMAVHRGFSSAEQQDEHIIQRWNSIIKKHDTVWILGDITMEKGNYKNLALLKGYKKVVLGNHDLPQHIPEMLKYVNCVCGVYMKMKGLILSHFPVHPSELRGRINIHGHNHYVDVPDERYINVSAEMLDYTPVLISDLVK